MFLCKSEQKNWKIKKIGKKIIEKTESWKKSIKPIKILKKSAGSVRFYKPKIKKTEPNQNPKNPEKTKPDWKNRAKPVFVLKNQTEPKLVGLNRFRLFFFLISIWLLFFW